MIALLALVSLQVQTGFLDRNVTVGGKAYHYQVYVPADYAAKPAWPAILFLHGAGERGEDGLLAMLGSTPCSTSRTIIVPKASRPISIGVRADRSFQQSMIALPTGAGSPCACLSSPTQPSAAVIAPPDVPLRPTIL